MRTTQWSKRFWLATMLAALIGAAGGFLSGVRYAENTQPSDSGTNEEFVIFLARFSTDPQFQLERTADPIRTVVSIVDENFKEVENLVPLEQLRARGEPLMPILGGYYEFSVSGKSDAVQRVAVQSRRSDVYVKAFVFELRGCCWYLTETYESAY